MSTYQLAVMRNGIQTILTAEAGKSLLNVLTENNIYISATCGGKGQCGKCGVKMTAGVTPVMKGDEKVFDAQELKGGWRLSCLSFPKEDCSIVISSTDESDFEIVSDYQNEEQHECTNEQYKDAEEQCKGAKEQQEGAKESAYDIAIDIGTTTLAISLVGKDSKKVIHIVTMINHQRAFGADVISRIQASVDGKGEELKQSIRNDLSEGIKKLLDETGEILEHIEKIAIAGNTTMGHLLMGFSCKTLGVVPFTPVDISVIKTTYGEIFGGNSKIEIIMLPGISTYVGADITAGMLSCGFDHSDSINVLIDLGTNGEMAIGNKEKIMVTSTAAGPAFEGGNISCGMGSVQGAVCQVEINGEEVSLKTIGDKAPVGLCGTGVIETAYELLKEELIDETGMLDDDYFDDGFPLGKTPDGNDILFTQKDVREIQLAKSAVRAGLETLMIKYGVSYDQVEHLYLAGGFGYRMNLEKAMGIGLLPEEMKDKIIAVGNSSLGGAVQYLTDPLAPEKADRIVKISEEVELAADKNFNQFYMDYMFFE